MSRQSDNMIAIIKASRVGDGDAEAKLSRTLYDELRAQAAAMMRYQPAGQTLQPTALVHEAFLKVGGFIDQLEVADRAHLFRTVAKAMRQVLIDSARRKATEKHGGSMRREGEAAIEREVVEHGAGADPEVYVRLAEATDLLAEEDPQAAEVVRLKVFGGCTMDQIGEVLGVSVRTVHRDFEYARRWLAAHLAAG